MTKKKNVNLKINYKKLGITIAVIILLIILITVIVNIRKNSSLKLKPFEKAAVYGYIEDSILDVSTIYNYSGNTLYNDTQIFQANLKQALDDYFSSHPNAKEISTSEALSLVNSSYMPSSLDFHGIVVSDYTYNPDKETLTRTPGTNPGLSGIEASAMGTDYSSKKAVVTDLKKTSKDTYQVTFNIVEANSENATPEDSGSAIISFKDGIIKLDSCELNK